MRVMPATRRAVALTAYGLLVLTFFEATSRFVLSSDSVVRKLPLTSEASWRLHWIHSRWSRRIWYPFDVHHPVRGWALRRNLQGITVFRDKILSTNSRGLRGTAEHDYKKRSGFMRILIFGDSFTFGDEVGDDETYPAYRERKLPGAEVLNFGVHGYGHDQMLLYLREEGVKYRADVVVLGFAYDDLARNSLEFRDYAKPRFVLEDGRLALRNVPVPRPRQILARERYRPKFADLLSILFAECGRRMGWVAAAREDALQKLAAALLDEMRATILAMGARPAYAYLPLPRDLGGPDPRPTREEDFYPRYCRTRGLEPLLLRRVFIREMANGTPVRMFGHYGPRENEIVASALAEWLSRMAPRPGPPPPSARHASRS